MTLNVLAIGAHPDDLETLCGGTLAKYAKQGARVHMCNLTNGSRGYSPERHSREEIIRIRRTEAEKAAGLIGAILYGPFVDDLELYPSRELRDRVVDVMRAARADVILTLWPEDYCADHRYASQVVFDAAHDAALPAFRSSLPAHEYRPPIYYMEPAAGINFLPEEFVDISEVMSVKEEMLLCHQSQVQWLGTRDHARKQMLHGIQVHSAFRGLQCGCSFAEGFRRAAVSFRIRPERILP